MLIQDKLKKIDSFIRNIIGNYRACANEVNFHNRNKGYYIYTLLGYFDDLFEVIFQAKQVQSITDKFSYQISLLQAIYIQQDFTEELLWILKCDVNKGALSLDENYSINRSIRNELVGHPIRRKSNTGSDLTSSSIFSLELNDKLEYLHYHIDNEYNAELKSYPISQILERHRLFLDYYFGVIIKKLEELKQIVLSDIIKLENVFKKGDFEKTLKLTNLYFEEALKCDYLYQKDILRKAWEERKEHPRYQNVIDTFLKDLEAKISNAKHDIGSYFNETPKDINIDTIQQEAQQSQEARVSYELQKLYEKHPLSFSFLNILKNKYSNNPDILEELTNMEDNKHNDLEYYSSLNLISELIKE